MNNYTDELIESQTLNELRYGGYTSPYLQLPEGERTAAANAFTKTMKEEQYVDYDLLHKSLDATLYNMGLLGMFDGDGAFNGRDSYGHLKEYPDQKNGVISFLKKIWSTVFGSQFGNVKTLPAKTKADKEAEEKRRQEKAAQDALNAQHDAINKQALALEDADIKKVNEQLTKMFADKYPDYKKLLARIAKDEPNKLETVQVKIIPWRNKMGSSLFSMERSSYIEELPDKTWKVDPDQTKCKIYGFSCGLPAHRLWSLEPYGHLTIDEVQKTFDEIDGKWGRTAEIELNHDYDMDKTDDYIIVRKQLREFAKQLSTNEDVDRYIIRGKNTGNIYRTDEKMAYVSDLQGNTVDKIPADEYELVGATMHWSDHNHNVRRDSHSGSSVAFNSKIIPKDVVEKWGFRYENEVVPKAWGQTKYFGPKEPAPVFKQNCNADVYLSYETTDYPTD